jgi:threonine/homoserine/homoserine lactone efflux protein
MQAAAFQWINPKALFAVIGGVALYVRPGQEWIDFPLMLAVMTVVTMGAVALWTGFGVALRQFLRDPGRARIFNISMALLLVVSIVPMVL